ncbi:MAG TPA: hypothetical protein DHV28_13490 [Ignavibacteriales bacterium]|nr:hypothetical protein [Ignavibacteriales bacterium]
MSDRHSNSEGENILSANEIEKNLFNSKEHFDLLNWISKLIDKLFVYLSFIEGVIIVVGLIYIFIK